jgi:DNA primase
MLNEKNVEQFLIDLIPNGRKSGEDHVRGGCPICGEEDKFYINFNKALERDENTGFFVPSYQCFKGDHKGGSIFDLLKITNNLNLLNLKRTIPDNKDSFQIINIDSMSEIDDCKIMDSNLKLDFNTEEIGTHPFLNNRGWRAKEFAKYEVLVSKDKYRDYVFIGIKQRGNTVAYLGRSTKDAEYIKAHNTKVKESGEGFVIQKFRNSWGVDFSKILGGLDDITPKTHTLIVVEGIFDKVAVDNKLNLEKNDFFKCVFTFGKSFKKYQINIVKKFTNVKNIIIFYDGDAVESSKKTAKMICNEFNSVKIALLENGDPDESSTEEVKLALRNAKKQEEFFTINKLWD